MASNPGMVSDQTWANMSRNEQANVLAAHKHAEKADVEYKAVDDPAMQQPMDKADADRFAKTGSVKGPLAKKMGKYLEEVSAPDRRYGAQGAR